MEFKDYYQILGVAPDADEATIKSTFRKLARQYHPDVNPGNQGAEEKFKEINEAYQALSTPEARKKYDDLRAQYQRFQQSGGRSQDFNWGGWAAQPGEGVHVQYASAEDLEDMFGGSGGFSDFFSTLFGQARPQGAAPGGGGGRGRASPRRGRDLEFDVDVSLEEAFHGAARLLQGEDRRIEARIPPGVRTGSRVRLAGQGGPGLNGGPAGDLFLIVRVLPHPSFEREGDDLYTDVPVDFFTAVAGGEVRAQTLDKPVMLRIPPGTQAGRSFRLKGKGMPRLGKPDERGDLYARARLTLPENLTGEETDAIRALAEKRRGTG